MGIPYKAFIIASYIHSRNVAARKISLGVISQRYPESSESGGWALHPPVAWLFSDNTFTASGQCKKILSLPSVSFLSFLSKNEKN